MGDVQNSEKNQKVQGANYGGRGKLCSDSRCQLLCAHVWSNMCTKKVDSSITTYLPIGLQGCPVSPQKSLAARPIITHGEKIQGRIDGGLPKTKIMKDSDEVSGNHLYRPKSTICNTCDLRLSEHNVSKMIAPGHVRAWHVLALHCAVCHVRRLQWARPPGFHLSSQNGLDPLKYSN